MPRYRFTAIKEGKTLQGTVEASNRESLVSSLAREGAHPILIKEEGLRSANSLLSKLRLGKRVKTKELAIFTRQLSVMVSAGVPLTRALTTLQDQTAGKYFKSVVAGIAKDVEGGTPLAESFAKYPDVFSEVYINMVRAGETGGILDTILKRISTQVEQDESMRKKIKSAMAYPTVILIITVIAFFGITVFVIPKIGGILTDLGGEDASLPIYTQLMLGLSGIIQRYFLLIIVLMIAGVFLLRRYIRTDRGKYQFHSLLLRTPVINAVVVKVAVARFARTFASLMSSGVSVLDSLEVTGGALGNKVMQKELEAAAKEVKNGKQLSEPLGSGTHFPPIVAQMLAVGEETGQVDKVLIKVADFYEEEVSVTIDGLSSIIEPLMIVVLGGMVGLIAASVMGPIASLSQNIGA